jgi:hypothetical protein
MNVALPAVLAEPNVNAASVFTALPVASVPSKSVKTPMLLFA